MAAETFSETRVFAYVGQRLSALRVARGLRQQDVCKLINVSHQQYQKYEDGSTKIALHRLLTLARFYDAPIEHLIPADNIRSAIGNGAAGFSESGTPPLHPKDKSPLADADELASLYLSIRDPGVRDNLLALAKSIAKPA